MKLRAFGQTHPGYVRDNNEDAFVLVPEAGVFVVADGMAGHQFGELASTLAIDAIRSFYRNPELDNLLQEEFVRAKRAGMEKNSASYGQYKLRRAVEEANLAIFNAARRNPQYESMGTTIAAAAFAPGQAFIAHVGDSRAYRLRADKLQRLTADHSLVNEYLRARLISKEDAQSFPMKNVILRALGLEDHVPIDLSRKSLAAGDVFLLATDGLTDQTPDPAIAACLRQHAAPEQQVAALISRALAAGGPDNVTALSIVVEDPA